MSERLDVVNEDNQVISEATREEIHNNGSWHRGVHILVLDEKNRVILQMRSPEKDKFPNHYDCSVSEHLKRGERYETAAVRGLREELKISSSNTGLKRLIRFKMNYGPNDNMISELFECHYDGQVHPDENEIQSLETFSLSKVKEMLKNDESKFAPWTKEILKWYLRIPSQIKILFKSSVGL